MTNRVRILTLVAAVAAIGEIEGQTTVPAGFSDCKIAVKQVATSAARTLSRKTGLHRRERRIVVLARDRFLSQQPCCLFPPGHDVSPGDYSCGITAPAEPQI